MSLRGLLDLLGADRGVHAAQESAAQGQARDIWAPDGVRGPLTATLAQHSRLLVVTATGRIADDVAADVRSYLDPHRVAVFGAWETLPHERLSPRNDTVAKRLAVLRRLAHPDPEVGPAGPIDVLVAPIRSVLQPLVAGLGEMKPVRVKTGDTISMDALVQSLIDAAYVRVDMVERRGEVSVRGGIVDVFPPTQDHPVRVEFFGDEVEEIREFAVADQRSLGLVADGLWAPACREMLLTPQVRQRAAALKDRIPAAADMLDKISAGIAVEGMESLAPVLVDRMESVIDVLHPDTHLVVFDQERVRSRAHDLVATNAEFLAAAWSNATVGNAAPVDLGGASFLTFAQVREQSQARNLPWWTVSAFAPDDEDAVDVLKVQARPVQGYGRDVAKALVDLKNLAAASWTLVVTTPGQGPAKRIAEQLSQADIPASVVPDLASPPQPGLVTITTAPATAGFVHEELNLAMLTEADLLGRSGPGSTTDMRRLPSRRRNQVDPLQLRPGDYVVHEQHGVGRFVEMVQRTIQGALREYLVVEYAASKKGHSPDRLFVPTDTLDQISRYVGGEAPSVNKLGGSDWSATKAKARKAVRQIAGELVRLYSARMATKGHAFGPDTPWQRELEDAFAYVETPDQLASIDEVKADMEKSLPMDRLICGDVGYGKTEIAIRAAFKAVQDGKQVAILVPTTLLVQQHLDTFSERFAAFPVTVKALSRFQSDSESAETMQGISDGTVDVVIGTHRLLTSSFAFKDLGLVVIDEEQRFGVEHKETLKQLRTNVDVLAMSATPIPRTLEMAVTGIREMSTLTTPPEERHPVLTFVGPYDEKQVTAAIRRELLREGQVFFVHNRVSSIDRAVSRLRDLVPEARIGAAHGKMGEHQLEQVIMDFWEKRLDVLVCTTIVETGLDIPNANTLILERADLLGLSQLHQLRGRVGRGRERAYAYLLYPPEVPLTQTAHDRLATLAQHTDLGAGMQVAMKDLEIRGAGNLLGGEQSGHIAGVGFDLYVRLVGEAVSQMRGDGTEEVPEIKIELPVDAHLPHSYIPHERLRLEAYRRLATADSIEAVAAAREELVDRYGQPGPEVENLLAVARFRVLCREVGISEVGVQGKHIRFAPVDLRESQQLRLRRLFPGTLLKPVQRSILVPRPTTARIGGTALRDTALLDWAADLMKAVLQHDIAAAASSAKGAGGTA